MDGKFTEFENMTFFCRFWFSGYARISGYPWISGRARARCVLENDKRNVAKKKRCWISQARAVQTVNVCKTVRGLKNAAKWALPWGLQSCARQNRRSGRPPHRKAAANPFQAGGSCCCRYGPTPRWTFEAAMGAKIRYVFFFSQPSHCWFFPPAVVQASPTSLFSFQISDLLM